VRTRVPVATGGVRVGFGGFWNEVMAYVPAGGAGLDGPLLSLLHPCAAIPSAAARSSKADAGHA